MIPTVSDPAPIATPSGLFQSRNRETYDSNAHQ